MFRRATAADHPAVVEVVNAASSGEAGSAGWTHEHALFGGERIDAAELRGMLEAPGSIVVLRIDGGVVAGCAYLKPAEGGAYLGLLSVRPRQQASGIGGSILAECERIARDEWRCARIVMSVITSHRPELTAYYERRGYVRTGRFKAVERRQAIERAKVAGIRPEWMEKDLVASSPGTAPGG